MQVVKKSDDDQVTVIGCCVTLVEALRAADTLAAEDIKIRVIDPFTLKPFDAETVITNAKATGGRVITVEDHYEWGMYMLFTYTFGVRIPLKAEFCSRL